MSYQSFAVILTAVEVENAAILRAFNGFKPIHVPGDDQLYHETFFQRPDEEEQEPLRLITARQQVMGMTAASALATKVVETFRPKYLLMSGIAAGTGEASVQMYGDVLVPDVIWDYSTGKYVGPDEAEIRFGDIGFLPRPVSLATDPGLLNVVRQSVDAVDNEFHVHIGPIACGSSVVANANMVDRQIRALFPRTVGLDMESYSVYFAAANAREPRPKALVVKSICDFADSDKSDQFQKFAAYTSAGYLKYLIENRLSR